MPKGKLVAVTAIVAVIALIALIANTDSGQAKGNFGTSYGTVLNDVSADGPGNQLLSFGYAAAFPANEMNFAAALTTTPPDVAITPGSSIPVGRIVGSLSANVFLGVLNGHCITGTGVDFTMRNATTDVRNTIAPMPEGTFNRMGNLRMDVTDGVTGTPAAPNPNGNADFLDKYPKFLNKLFDPNDSAATGALPVFPLKPLARYSGGTNVQGTDVVIQFLVFGREALTQFANSGGTHPLEQFTDDTGYVSTTILQDPTAAAAPSTVTDFCGPFTSTTNLTAAIDPEATAITNQCANDTDDDGDGTVDPGDGSSGDVNDFCPAIGIEEEGAQCLNDIDDGEDTPPDGAVNDGCGQNDLPELAAAANGQCAGDGTTTLSMMITDMTDPIPVVSTASFDTLGTIQIESEIISYKDTTANTFIEITRGVQGTTPAGHADTTAVTESVDDDLDGTFNDGCPQSGTAETAGQCTNNVDNDGDSLVNDGCPTISDAVPAGFTATRYANPPPDTGLFKTNTHLYLSFNMSLRDADKDGLENTFDTCPFTNDNDGDGLAEGPGGADTFPWINVVRGDLSGGLIVGKQDPGQDDDNDLIPAGCDTHAGTECGNVADDDTVLPDGSPNDGCANFETGENPWCATGNLIDEDDGGSGLINDGCPTHFIAESDCTDAGDTTYAQFDDDGDGFVNDGCPAVSGTEDQLQCGTDTFDDDGDDVLNDGCPLVNNIAETGGGGDVDGDGFENTQDNCPQVANPNQVQSELLVPFDTASPDGGPRTDGIGDACQGVSGVPGNLAGLGNKAVADGHYHATLHVTAVCIGPPSLDTDGDGWCDATETGAVEKFGGGADTDMLGSCADDSVDTCSFQGFPDCDGPDAGSDCDPEESTPEHIAVDYALPITNGTAVDGTWGENDPANMCGGGTAVCGTTSACGNGVNDDPEGGADTTADDGCGAIPILPAIAAPAQTCSDGIDNDGDGDIDSADNGCPPTNDLANDSDGDGVCNGAVEAGDAGLCGEVASVDNCQDDKNPNQHNTDAFLNSDAQTVDPDDTGPNAPALIPADAFGNACDPDDDNDSWTGLKTVVTGGATNGACRSSVSVPVFNDCIEQYLGTDQFDNCPETSAVDAWAVNLNQSSEATDQRIDGLDVVSFNNASGTQDLRADFNADLSVNLFDAFLLRNIGAGGDGWFNKTCLPDP